MTLLYLVVLSCLMGYVVNDLPSTPHIIFIVADDLGYNDVGWNNENMTTPNMDYLAKNGVILDANYVFPLCTPSRVAFMTGRYPHTMGLQRGIIKGNEPNYIPLSVNLVPQKLQQQGYATHMIGKWHLGYCNELVTPTKRGFDSFFGFYHGAEDYYDYTTGGFKDFRKDLSPFDPSVHGYAGYSTEAYAERAIEIIEDHNYTKPMFLYMAFHAPHTPLQVPAEYEEEFNFINDETRRTFSGMVKAMDRAIGAVVQKLNDTAMLDKAVIVFTSDNGGATGNGGNNLPYRGAKGTFWEGGIRVPGFVYSKTELNKSGYRSNKAVHATDWFATFLNLAGGNAGEEDINGTDQWNTLSNDDIAARTSFVLNFDSEKKFYGIRSGQYKLMAGSPGDKSEIYHVPNRKRRSISREIKRLDKYLFDLDDNPEEDLSKNLIDDKSRKYRLIKRNLLQEMEDLLDTMMDPYSPDTTPDEAKAAAIADGGFWAPGWCSV